MSRCVTPEINHAVEETELQQVFRQTWSESLFYGLGNKKMKLKVE